jgi:outer membrane cobalamin receptor
VLLNERVSLFAGYSEGFRGVSNFFGLAPPVPETSRQYEIGAKFAAAGGLSGSVAAFRLDRRNVIRARTKFLEQRLELLHPCLSFAALRLWVSALPTYTIRPCR